MKAKVYSLVVRAALVAGACLFASPLRAEALDAALFRHVVAVQFSSGAPEAPLEDFPVLVKLAEGNPAGFSYADCAADAFRFTDEKGNALPHDVEVWDPSGTSLVWVSVPNLFRGAAIFFRYGAEAAQLPANTPSEVWTRAGYVGVWHMAEASGAVADAAGNGLAATPKGAAEGLGAVDGPIGSGRATATEAARGYLSVPSYDALALGGAFTVSAWIKASTVNGWPRLFSRKAGHGDNDGWEIELSSGSASKFAARAATTASVSGSLPDLTADWRLVTFAYDGNTVTAFGDGARVASGAVTSAAPDNGRPLSLGCDSDGNESWLDGAFDEARLRRGASSAAWVEAEYANIRGEDFIVLSRVDEEVKCCVVATAGAGGQVAIDGGAPGASAASAGVALGTSCTAALSAVPAEGYRFFRWTGDVSQIASGDAYSPDVTVTTSFGAALTATFVSKTGGGYVEIVNAFDHPAGGFTTASCAAVPGSVFSNRTDCVIAFTAPDDAPAGLRAFTHLAPSAAGFTDDWGYFKDFAVAQTAATEAGVACAAAARTGLGDKGVVTYAGSWYVPAAGTYAFRLHMAGTGQLVLDNRLVLRQTAAGTAAATNGVALAKGWHNFYAVFPARGGAVGPADAAVPGLLFSAADADLAADPAQGTAFAAAAADGHRLSTAFSGVFVPSLWAAGGDVLLDCANALGDVRVAGQWGSIGHAFAVRNLRTGAVLEVGCPVAGAFSVWGMAGGVQSLDAFAWIDWSRTSLPAGTPVRFEGAAAVSAPLPAGSAWTLGRRVYLATTVADFFGVVAAGAAEFRFPDGLAFLQAGSPAVLGDRAKIFVAEGQMLDYAGGAYYLTNSKGLPLRFGNVAYTFKNDLDVASGGYVNATAPWDGNEVWAGDITGDGTVGVTGWGRRMNLSGSVTASSLSAGQLGCRLNLRPRAGAPASRVGTVFLADESKNGTESGWDYFPPTLFYCPADADAPPLSVGTVKASNANWWPNKTKCHRQGSTLSTCSNHTVNVASLTGAGLHLRTVVPAGTNDDPAEVDRGFGNFTFGAIDAAMTLYVSSNVNVAVTNVNKATAFRYEVCSNGVNDAVLDIFGACAPSTLSATDVAMLPARVRGFTGEVTLTETAAKTYPITLDFSKDAPNHGGCDGSGTLVAAPAAGAVEVTFAAGEPVSGEWGLVRFTAGGGLLAKWTVSAPQVVGRYAVKTVKDETGLWLLVRRGGMALILR